MKGSRWIGPAAGVAILLFFLLMPPLEPLTAAGMKTAGIFLFTIIWWATVGIGYPSLICIVLLAVTGVMTPAEVFANSLGSWLTMFLLGCFGLSEGLRSTGFSRRFAIWFITRPFTAGHPWLMVAMFLLACTLLASVMSSTASCIVFMTIAAPMLETLGYKNGDSFAAAFMMGIAWAATAALSMTPIAHAGNVLVMEWVRTEFGYTISFPQWMLFGIPMGLLIYLLILGTLRYVVHPDVSRSSGVTIEDIRRAAGDMGKMTTEEKLTLGIFLAVVVCWVLPGITENILPGVAVFLTGIGYAVPPVVGACLLCLIRVKNRPLMTFRQWTQDGVEWGTTILCAAVAVIGMALNNPGTGISELLTGIFQPVAASVPFVVFLFISILWVVLQTNLMPNLVALTLVYSIMVPVAAAAGTGNAIALGTAIAGAANCAFSLPSSTTTTALIIGSGWVSVRFLGKYGVILLLPIILIFTFLCYPLCSVIFG
jgi:sodium-dependent dicarboxylate transporter 2/3/5